MGCWIIPLGARSPVWDPGPQGLSQYYWASSPSYSLVLFKLLDSQPELRLVVLLLLSRVTPSGTLKELIVLLICRAGVLGLELEAVLDVGYRWGSERVKLFIEVTGGQFGVLFFRDECGLHPGILFLHSLDLAHRKVPPLLGED